MRYFLATIAILLGFQTQSQAQLFGARNFGKSLQVPTRDSLEDVGTLSGTERFIRGNTAKDFIGTDSADTQGFIGAQQSDNSGRVRDTSQTIRPERQIRVNRPLSPSSGNEMYDPKLTLSVEDFSIEPGPSAGSDPLSEDSRLDSLRSALAKFGNVELQMDGAVATIRGTVSSEREKRMAGYLASFEPEIDSVRNELSVQSDR